MSTYVIEVIDQNPKIEVVQEVVEVFDVGMQGPKGDIGVGEADDTADNIPSLVILFENGIT